MRGLPSKTLTVHINNRAPVPASPTQVAPAADASVSLPFTFDWTDTANPQVAGYDLDVDTDPNFGGEFGATLDPGHLPFGLHARLRPRARQLFLENSRAAWRGRWSLVGRTRNHRHRGAAHAGGFASLLAYRFTKRHGGWKSDPGEIDSQRTCAGRWRDGRRSRAICLRPICRAAFSFHRGKPTPSSLPSRLSQSREQQSVLFVPLMAVDATEFDRTVSVTFRHPDQRRECGRRNFV